MTLSPDERERLLSVIAGLREAASKGLSHIEVDRADYFDCCTVAGDPETMDDADRDFMAQIDAVIASLRTALRAADDVLASPASEAGEALEHQGRVRG